jgi:hypothetical protein
MFFMGTMDKETQISALVSRTTKDCSSGDARGPFASRDALV